MVWGIELPDALFAFITVGNSAHLCVIGVTEDKSRPCWRKEISFKSTAGVLDWTLSFGFEFE